MNERGSVLLVVLVLAAASAAASAALLDRAWQAAAELRARREVLCARYAALGGLALGGTTAADGSAASLVGGEADFLAVSLVRLSPTWCVRRAEAACGDAVRSYDRTLEDAAACDAAPG